MSPYNYSKIITSRGLTYSYIHIHPFQQNGQYILFLHGFPSSARDWRHQISHFSNRGYGIIAPNCLGYGGTSKPLDTSFYNIKAMAADVHDILVHEKIEKAIGVAHDWGSFLLSRLVNYYPGMFVKLAFLDIGYSIPGQNLTEQTVRSVNKMVMEKLGYSVFGYFLFFNESDSAQLMDAHRVSVQSLFHQTDEDLGKKYMGAEGGMRIWLTEGKVSPPPPYPSPEDQQFNRTFFSPENCGYGPSINWYKAQLANINDEDDKGISEENRILQQPTLYLESTNFITATADFPNQMKAKVPKLEAKKLDCGHWIMLEKIDETNAFLEQFFEKPEG